MRSLAFAFTTVSLGVSAHVLGGGLPPSPGVIALLCVAIVLCAEGFSRSECGSLTLLTGVLMTQLVVHLVCMDAAPAGMQMARAETPRMVAAHLCAAALVAALLRHAESGVWRVRRWLGLLLPDVVGLSPTFAVRRSAAGVCLEEFAGHGLLLAAAHGRRGPPLSC